MPIPDYQTVMLPLLRLVKKEPLIHYTKAIQIILDEFSLSNDERKQKLPSGIDYVINNRVGCARTYLKKAGLITYPERGLLELTDRGEKVLSENLSRIDVKFLRQFQEFQDFQALSKADSNTTDSESTGGVMQLQKSCCKNRINIYKAN